MEKHQKLNIDIMDWKYIVHIINNSLLSEHAKIQIHLLLNQGFKLSDISLDYLLIAIKHNNDLVPSYKRHLSDLVKEMNGGLDE